MLAEMAPNCWLTPVDSKLSCPVYGAQDLSGSSLHLLSVARRELFAHTGPRSDDRWARDRSLRSFRPRRSQDASINRPSAWYRARQRGPWNTASLPSG